MALPLVLLGMAAYSAPAARADLTPLGNASNYAVLYKGTGGHNLSITNVTINGNVGVGGTGAVQFSGPGTINGQLDFSASSSGQYHNTNGSNVGPSPVNYNVANVTSDLSALGTLNTTLEGLTETNVAISGTQTINESAGQSVTSGGITYRVFNVTSYSVGNGNVVTINGDGSGNPVVLNFAFNSNVNLGGDVKRAVWLLGPGLLGLAAIRRKFKKYSSTHQRLWAGSEMASRSLKVLKK